MPEPPLHGLGLTAAPDGGTQRDQSIEHFGINCYFFNDWDLIQSIMSGLGLMSADAPVFCICGPSAAGKTTFAVALQQRLAARGIAVLQIACDDYYRSDWTPHPLFGYDTVEAVDSDALRHDLVLASKHQATSLRLYDMRSRRVDRRPIASSYDLILLEGSYGPQELLGGFPLASLVYLEESLPLRLYRRLRRDVRDRHRPPHYVIRQMVREMLPGERAFIRPLRVRADLVVRDQARGINALLTLIDTALEPTRR